MLNIIILHHHYLANEISLLANEIIKMDYKNGIKISLLANEIRTRLS